MKPAPFDYVAPHSLDEAVAALADGGADAKLLAGGQSLIPLLNFRLARPSLLVDLNRVAELAYVSPRERGLAVGAMARQAAVERPLAQRGNRALPPLIRCAHPIGLTPNQAGAGPRIEPWPSAAKAPTTSCHHACSV